MLPAKLSEIKIKLVDKGFSKRTTDEDKLLEELEEVDRVIGRGTLSKSTTFSDSETRMTRPPSDRCSCCGR